MKIINKLQIIILILFIQCNVLTHVSASGLLLRDTEIEDTLRQIAEPIFKIADLDTSKMHIFVINSNEINAFTIGGGYIFINSGLILKLKKLKYIVGILSHEIAHLKARHIDKLLSVIQNTNSNMATLLTAAAISSVFSPAAIALLICGMSTQESIMLRFSREEELAADSLAAKFLTQLHCSPTWLCDVFNEFARMDIMSGIDNLPVYFRSHPKPEDRIFNIKKYIINNEKYSSNIFNQSLSDKYEHIVFKLMSLINKNDYNFVPKNEHSKAIYLHNNGKSEEAISILKKLFTTNPNNIYYAETFAHILYETNNLKESIKIYKNLCLKLNVQKYYLIYLDYARVLIASYNESKNICNLNNAIDVLKKLDLDNNDYNDEAYRLLGEAYGYLNDIDMANYMIARERLCMGDYSNALILFKNIKQSNRIPKNEFIAISKRLCAENHINY